SVDRMKGVSRHEDFVEENSRFHSLIADASMSPVMAIFWSTIRLLAAGDQYGVKYSKGNVEHVVKAHQAIVDAIRGRDTAEAAEMMASHLGELEHLIGKRYQNLLNHATTSINRSGRSINGSS